MGGGAKRGGSGHQQSTTLQIILLSCNFVEPSSVIDNSSFLFSVCPQKKWDLQNEMGIPLK
jgi:hypothetical protein